MWIRQARTRMKEAHAFKGVTFEHRGKSPIAFTEWHGQYPDTREWNNEGATRKSQNVQQLVRYDMGCGALDRAKGFHGPLQHRRLGLRVHGATV